MKRLVPIALIVLAVSVLAVLIWYVNGSQNFRFEKSVALPLTVEETYQLLTNERLQQKWGNGRQDVTRLTTGEYAVGTKTTYGLINGEDRYDFEEEVLELNEPQYIVLKISTELFETTQTYELSSEASGGTQLKVTVKGHLKGKAKWGGSYVRAAIEERVAAELETLRWTVSQSPDFQRVLRESMRR